MFFNTSKTQPSSEIGGVLLEVALLVTLMLFIGVVSLTHAGEGVNNSFCNTWYYWRLGEEGSPHRLELEEQTFTDTYCPAIPAGLSIGGYG